MRQIRITKEKCLETDDGTLLACPVISTRDMPCGCSNKCAWFRIDLYDPDVKNAYCGDKLIGEIKEKTDG